MAITAIAFNLLVLPRIAGQLYRPGERVRDARSGIVLYPISVLLLVLLFPNRLDIAGAAWAILAVGDGMATIAGRRMGWGAIPWNREKSFAGTFALFLCGGLGGNARRLVVPAERDADSRGVVLGCGTTSRGARCRVCRNDPNQAGRQSLCSRLGRRRALGALARSRGPRRSGDCRRRSRDPPRRGRERGCRVAWLSGGHSDIHGSGCRRDHRHRDRGHDRVARAGRCCWRHSWPRRSARGSVYAARRSSGSPKSVADAVAPGTRSPIPASPRSRGCCLC